MVDAAAAGFAQPLTPGSRPALVVIDMVRAYFEPGSGFYIGHRDCLDSASRLLAAAREAGILVLHTTVTYSNGGQDGGYFLKKLGPLEVFKGNNRLGETMPEVAPLDDEIVIPKQYASAFFGTSLSSTLAANGIDTVLIAGVSTSGCIRASTVDAIQYGFKPFVIRDAVGDRADGPHEANLYDLQAKYAEVVSEDYALDYLRSLPS